MRRPLLAAVPAARATAPSDDPAAALTFAKLSRGFEEPLVPTATRSAEEDAALDQAIDAHQSRTVADDFTALEGFLGDHPHSPWRLALLTDLGLAYYHAGYFDRAIGAFEQAWSVGRDVTEPQAKALADRAAGELLKMHARLGHAERLAALLDEMKDRELWGAASELRDGARQGLWTMRNRPGIAYLCGPAALRNLLLALGTPEDKLGAVDTAESGPHGVTLTELGRLADGAKLPHVIVQRTADEPIPVPSIIHWRASHYAAIVGEHDGRYEIRDPTFGPTLLVTRKAIDAEGSGYFLVPTSAHATAWRTVSDDEASRVFGMGATTGTQQGATTSGDSSAQSNNGPCGGLCGYSFSEMTVSLRINDTPLGYKPPIGPAIPITVTYNQRSAGVPQTPSFYNLGPNWSLNWQSYIVDDPRALGAGGTGNAGTDRFPGGGGYIDETGFASATGTFQPETYDGSVLTLVSASPVVYTRTLPDGTVETYAQSNGAASYPRYVFLSKVTDPQGNAVTLSYDAMLRLTALTDPTGLQTTLAYGLQSSPLLVTQVNDPFGRNTKIAYDGSGRLQQITDEQGLVSKLAYNGATTFVSTLTTPYGATQFAGGGAADGSMLYLQATDPLGYTERLEYLQTSNVPASEPVAPNITGLANSLLQYRNTFYWDKHAYAVGAGDYTKARIHHWAHVRGNQSVMSNFLESEKSPLENRVWYEYPGPQGTARFSGTLNKPIAVARVLDDGSTQLTKYAYTCGDITGSGYTAPCGNLAMRIDPMGRQTMLTYAANGIDLSSVQQKQGSAFVTVASFPMYDTNHRPQQSIDAAGQTTQYFYNGVEQPTKVTDPLGYSTRYTYNNQRRLASVIDANQKTTLMLIYDGTGRVKTATDSEGYTLAYAYDNLDRLKQQTFPDGTTRTYQYNVLDLYSVTDRQNRTTTYGRDADRYLRSVTDPLNRVTQFGRYENGALATLTDPNSNVTQWAVDVQSRVTGKQYADSSVVTYGYEATTSRLKTTTDALGQAKTYGYYADDQLAGIAYTGAINPTPNVAFGYGTFFPYRTSMSDGNGTTTYTYNPVGQLGALQVAVEQPPFNSSLIRYTYDQLGRPASRKVDGEAVPETFGYDPLGRLSGHQDALGTFVRTYLGETGQLTNQTNSVVGTTWSYDTNVNDRKLIGVTNTPGTLAGAPNASAYTFQNALEGDITQIVDAYNNQTLTPGYDAADRLQGVTSAGTYNYGYTYDPADNPTKITRPTGSASLVPNALNQVTTYNSVRLSYDLNGNLLRDATATYAWDAENRLVGITYANGSSSSFAYDGLGRRTAIGSTSGGVTTATHYGWCGSVLCQARDGQDNPVRRYLVEGEDTPAQNMHLYYAVDQLGSVRDALDASTGASVAHYDYDPYGAPLGRPKASATDFRFAGLFYHQPSGLYLSATRAMDPTDGRWESRDPLGEIAGFNLYAYAGNGPVVAVDPEGTDFLYDYLSFVTNHAIDPGAFATSVLIGGGVFPKRLSPQGGFRGPALGSSNPLTSFPRGVLGLPAPAARSARSLFAIIGAGEIVVGLYNAGVAVVGVFAAGLGSASSSPADPNGTGIVPTQSGFDDFGDPALSSGCD